MPLELVTLEFNRKAVNIGDRGFLISVAKSRWTKNSANEAVKLLKSYAQQYYNDKCPETVTGAEEDVKEEQGESEEKSEKKTTTSTENSNHSPVVFVQRKLVNNNCGFIATNLSDPADYVHYLMTQFAEAKDSKTKFPFRIMPVHAVCEARPKAVEAAAIPLIERILGVDEHPYRFSLMYRGKGDGDHLTQQEAKAIVRNCVWAVNPNCVQCIKYQDYALIIDIIDPLFCIGIGKDFQRLAGYNTRAVRMGMDLTDLGDDSEDDISDDPTLDEEDEKRRKLRIKKKRHAEKAALANPDGEVKKRPEGDEEEGHDEEMQEDNDAADEHF